MGKSTAGRSPGARSRARARCSSTMTARWSGSRRRRPRRGRARRCWRCWRRLERRLDGALAIVSGRGVADIDEMLAPLRLTVAGLHGLELRPRDGGCVELAATGEALLAPARSAMAEFDGPVPGNPGRGQAFELGLALPSGAGRGRGGRRSWPSAWRRRVEGHCGCSGERWWWSCCRRVGTKAARSTDLLALPDFAGRVPGLRRRRRHRRGGIPRRQRARRDSACASARQASATAAPALGWPISLTLPGMAERRARAGAKADAGWPSDRRLQPRDPADRPAERGAAGSPSACWRRCATRAAMWFGWSGETGRRPGRPVAEAGREGQEHLRAARPDRGGVRRLSTGHGQPDLVAAVPLSDRPDLVRARVVPDLP